MKFALAPLLCAGLLLTGCTDIRSRLSPDVLAVENGTPARVSMHATQDGAVFSVNTANPMLFQEALRLQSGSEISAGHLSLLLVSGNPAAVLPDFLQAQFLSPTCKVLYLPEDACAVLEAGSAPTAGQLDAAAAEGLLPCRTANLICGDLCGGSGVSALPAYCENRLTLAVFDAEGVCGLLSEQACRGLALLGGRYEAFSFDADGAPCTVQHSSLHLTASGENGRLVFTVSGSLAAETADPEAAKRILTDMLQAALTETAGAYGADILFLHETALRDGISFAEECGQAAWRNALRSAQYRVALR